MGNVISFRRAKEKKEMEEELWERRTRIEDTRKSLEEVRKEEEMDEEERFEERFGEKYNDMPKMEPMPAAAKMQYLADAMIKLVPDIFHGNDWDIQYDTWMYFYDLYIMEFYPASESYIKENKKFERPYTYKFKPVSKEKLEGDLRDCLEQLITLCSEKTNEDKSLIMYQCARLFEIKEILFDT